MDKKRNAFRYWYVLLLFVMLFMVSCSGGPLAGKAVATVDSCSFIEQNEQLFTESEALTVNNLQEDVVVRQGSSLTLGVEENTLIAPTAYLLKNCQEPVQAVPLRPTAESKLSSGWIVNQRNPEAVGATGTVTVDQTFEPGKKHVLFVYSCRWIEEEEEKGWDCHGDDENPSKWMMISFTVESCTDGVQNGGETDVDCGGSCGAICTVDKSCQQNTDCQQGLQCNAQKRCAVPPAPPPPPPPVQAAPPAPSAAAPVAVSAAKVAQKRLPRFWAVGNSGTEQKILFSDDLWKTSKVQYSVTERGSLQDITFPDKKIGYAVGSRGKILKTTDTGTNWVAQTSGTTVDLFGIDCADATRCWVVGDKGTILFTENGGQQWIPQISGTPRKFEEVYFSDQNQGWAVGAAGYSGNDIIHTSDGGAIWETQKTGTNSQFFDIQCIDQNCWVVGSGVKVNMIQTIDGGATWIPVIVPGKEKLSAVQLVTFTTGYTAGSLVAFKTTDGGYTWQSLPIDKRWNFNDLFFIDENVGCGAGHTGGRSGRLFCTSDGGKTWTQFGEGSGMYFFYAVTGRS